MSDNDSLAAALFSRNLGTITIAQQQRLQHKTVTVIGCGGLGGFVIEELARMGVGRLLLSDPDNFENSNINRQLFAQQATLNHNKAQTAAQRIRDIHPLCAVEAYSDGFQERTDKLFVDTEIVVDCLDNVQARRELAALCSKKKLPLIHGAVDRWYGQLAVQLADNTLVGELLGTRNTQKAEPSPSVLACTVAVIGSLQAAETCKLLLDMESPLQNHWMSVDLKRLTFDII